MLNMQRWWVLLRREMIYNTQNFWFAVLSTSIVVCGVSFAIYFSWRSSQSMRSKQRSKPAKKRSVCICINNLSDPVGLITASKCYDLYLIALVSSDEAAAEIMQNMKDLGIIPNPVHPTRLLFCSTSAGKVSILRQLPIECYFDRDKPSTDSAEAFISSCTHIYRETPKHHISLSELSPDYLKTLKASPPEDIPSLSEWFKRI